MLRSLSSGIITASSSACYNLVNAPPVYGTIDETYQVRPAQVQRRIVPAEYETVTDSVMIAPERRIPHHRAAVYDTVTEKVLVAPASRRWEVTRDAWGNTVGCWVDVPARYGYQSRRVEVSPATVDYETVPAVYTQRGRVSCRPFYTHGTTTFTPALAPGFFLGGFPHRDHHARPHSGHPRLEHRLRPAKTWIVGTSLTMTRSASRHAHGVRTLSSREASEDDEA